MLLEDLPIEIIEKILGYLPRHAKQPCLLVCKSWYQVTLPGYNQYIQLLGSKDLIVLYRKMFHGPVSIKGNDIRCLSLNAEKMSDRYIVRGGVVRILNACTHLRTLQLLHDSNQFLEYLCQTRSELHLDALKMIYIPFNAVNRVTRDREFAAIFHYCQKIIQISFNINIDTLRSTPGNMDLSYYLSKFIRLQTLAIHFNNEVVLHDIVSACPQLESLRLFGASFIPPPTAKLQMYKADNATKKSIFSVKSQIHTLVVDTTLFTKDLLEYLAIHTKHLYQLTLCGSVSRGTQSVIAALTAYSKQPRRNALALKCIRFESYISYSNELIQQIFSSSLRRLNLNVISARLGTKTTTSCSI